MSELKIYEKKSIVKTIDRIVTLHDINKSNERVDFNVYLDEDNIPYKNPTQEEKQAAANVIEKCQIVYAYPDKPDETMINYIPASRIQGGLTEFGINGITAKLTLAAYKHKKDSEDRPDFKEGDEEYFPYSLKMDVDTSLEKQFQLAAKYGVTLQVKSK